MGYSDEEACLLAEIDPATLYRYCQKNKSFASKKELLKRKPVLTAKRNIVKALEAGDVDISKWLLERKAKEEFNPKYSVDINSKQEPITGFVLGILPSEIDRVHER